MDHPGRDYYRQAMFERLNAHFGHDIEVVRYGGFETVWNIAVECVECGEVLIDFDNPEIEKSQKPA